jgi:hypothetical protein
MSTQVRNVWNVRVVRAASEASAQKGKVRRQHAFKAVAIQRLDGETDGRSAQHHLSVGACSVECAARRALRSSEW